MSYTQPFSFKEFIKSNKPLKVTKFDYLHIVYKDLELCSDFIILFHELCYPNFIIINDLIYIKDMFEVEKYNLYTSREYTGEQIQYWMNLIEITGLFDDFSEKEGLFFSELLVKSWNAKIKSEFSQNRGKAKSIFDRETGEIFITITCN